MSNIIIPFRANLQESLSGCGCTSPSPFTNTYSTLFDGIDDYVGSTQTFLNSAYVFSYSFWAKKSTVSDSVAIGHRISTYQGAWFSWYTDNNVYWSVRRGANESIIFTPPYDTDWHHFLCTFDNGVANVYLDGVLKGTTTFTTLYAPATTGDDFRIGAIDSSVFGSSNIDEVALFDSVVPIADVWNGSGTPTDLCLLADPPLHWYRMGDGVTAFPTIPDVGCLATNDGTAFNEIESVMIVPDVP